MAHMYQTCVVGNVQVLHVIYSEIRNKKIIQSNNHNNNKNQDKNFIQREEGREGIEEEKEEVAGDPERKGEREDS